MSQYRELRGRVDAMFEGIRERHPASFACKLGCHSCCKPALTVNALEKAELKAHLSSRPEVVAELRELERTNPHGGKRCALLGAEGACKVYEARPIVCRSHGAPLQFRPLDSRDENLRARDVCPLNFKDVSLAEIPAADVMNLDTINVLLALLAKREFPGDESRTELKVSKLLE